MATSSSAYGRRNSPLRSQNLYNGSFSQPTNNVVTRSPVKTGEDQGYTEFFSWGRDDDGQLGHGQDGSQRTKIFNVPKSLSFEVLIADVSCGFAHTCFISSKISLTNFSL